MPFLSFFRGANEVMRFPLPPGPVKIGRHPSCDINLPDEAISRFHAVIELRGEQFWIVDQSRNGTACNGQPVDSQVLLDRDELTLGPWRVVFVQEESWSERETAVVKQKSSTRTFCGMVGRCEEIQKVFSLIEKVAKGDLTIMILGETGSGKELVARAIHDLSLRAREPFVTLNCGAISPQLIESELFGHEKGAFTGAISRHTGAFEQGSNGTLFLDEVGELPLELQPKLLRVLEHQRFRRVGGQEEINTDVRILAATHQNLETKIRDGQFREDLFFRLYGVPIVIPPLRERSEDIPLLVDFFLGQLQSGTYKKPSAKTMEKLKKYPWKGNVRELKNTLARALLLSTGKEILPSDVIFPEWKQPEPQSVTLQNRELDNIRDALKRHQWNKSAAAAELGIAKSTLFQRIRDYNIKDEGY